MKNKIKYILLVIISLSLTINIKALEIESCELSDAYIKWSNLPKEEQDKYIRPVVCKHKKSTVSSKKYSILKSSPLPSTYNARTTGKVTDIRNQRDVGSCWAFSSSSMAESYTLKNYSKTYQFSSRHMDYASSRYFLNGQINPNGYIRYAGQGGNSLMAANYMVNHYGPILESYMPFVNSTPQIALSEISGYPIQVDVNGVSFGTVYGDTTACSDDSINDMKNLIYNVGPITVSIYMGEDPSFFNSSTKALYNEVSGSGSNHSVLAVGWDDNYSIDNFVSTNKPSKPGAWIIQNSWGTGWGDGGLFYISYEDTTVCTDYSSIRSADLNVEDHIYSHDELGYDSSINLGLNAEGKKQGYTMNIFSKDSTNEEYIREVTFAMSSPGSYRIYAYKGNLITDGKNINNMQLIGSGTSSYEGYTTFKLDTPYKLDIGVSDFSVAVYYLANNVDDWVVGVSAYTYGVTIETGKSYASSNGLVWQDLAIANGQDNKSREASIKVSTDDAESMSTLFKVNSKEFIFDTPLKAVFDLKTRGVSGLSVAIKNSSNAVITPSSIEYEYLNDDYTKAIISFNNTITNGEYTFTFTYNTNLTNVQALSLSSSNITNIAFKDSKITIQPNSCKAFPEIIFTPSTNVIKNVTWSVKNGNVSISNNQLCVGNYSVEDDELTATSVNGISKSIPVDIIYDYARIENWPNYLEVEVGDEITIDDRNYDDRIFSRTVCFDRTNNNCTVYWNEMTLSVSDSTIISDLGNRKFKAIKAGTANINILSKNGKTSSVEINVQIPYTGISLNKETLNLVVGGSEKLIATATPSNATMSNEFTWSSSAPSVATVSSNGTVSAIGPGTTTIEVSTINGYYDRVVVTVSAPITSIALNRSNLSMIKGEKFTLTTTFTPSNTTDSKVIAWSSNNASVAVINSDGVVSAIGVGSTIITGTSINGKTSTCSVTVSERTINSVVLMNANKTINKGQSFTLTAVVNPSNTTLSKTITWTSSDESIATVNSNGLVTAVSIGEVKIKATSVNGKYAECDVTVLPEVINIDSVTISETNRTITYGQTFTLSANVNPNDTTLSKTITWTSSNINIATVNSNGLVTSVSVGNAIITAKSINGKTASCAVTVNPINIDSVSINTNSLNIEKYKSYTLVATVSPTNTTLSKTITWSSSNPNVVNVDSNGKITAKSIGKVIVTAKTINGKTSSCGITVTKVNASSINVSSISNKTYTGKQIKPSIKITYEGRTLKYKTDYTLKYGTNKNTGKGSIKITFKGSNYYGSKTVYFYIVPKKISIRTAKSYSKSTASIYYYRVTGASGYQVAYRKYGTTEWKYTNTKYWSKKITGLTRKKKYEVRVRAYKTVSGKKYYGSWSSKKTIKIK